MARKPGYNLQQQPTELRKNRGRNKRPYGRTEPNQTEEKKAGSYAIFPGKRPSVAQLVWTWKERVITSVIAFRDLNKGALLCKMDVFFNPCLFAVFVVFCVARWTPAALLVILARLCSLN